jgi:cell filamentation protein
MHKIIFEDIYEWAGQIRRGDFLSKGNSIFLLGLNKSKFIERMAYYMGEINALHPFREGNGRTAREFFRQLSLNAKYTLDFSKTGKDDLLTADIDAFNGKYDRLVDILGKVIM